MKRPGVVRECAHPGRPHRHGQECYRHDGCRCALGRADAAQKAAERRKARALGVYQAKHVDVAGSRRRLQALTLLGYTAAELGARTGLSRHAIYAALTRSRSIRRDKAELIRKAYDELWNVPAPDSTGAKYVSRQAKRRGYLPPLAWDDEDLDNPDAQPASGEPSIWEAA